MLKKGHLSLKTRVSFCVVKEVRALAYRPLGACGLRRCFLFVLRFAQLLGQDRGISSHTLTNFLKKV